MKQRCPNCHRKQKRAHGDTMMSWDPVKEEATFNCKFSKKIGDKVMGKAELFKKNLMRLMDKKQ